MSYSNGEVHWDVRFFRPVQDWEIEEVTDFFRLLYSVDIDNMRGIKFTGDIQHLKSCVRSYYKMFSDQRYISFPWKSIWKAHVPSKVAIFVWIAAIGNIQTIDNLRKRGMIVMEWCFMCKKAAESVDHLLLHCDVAKVLWDGVFRRSGLTWVMPKAVVDLLACWTRLHTLSSGSCVEGDSFMHYVVDLVGKE
ncbi:hypothetical protein F2P56_002294 [Juglans regia]|uniref:Reverse transcriptase zinc-binding domain-containing protein n=1 Tax=Juglans regia TaxID=51240 RepID=A0A833YEJ0_JUGRE|nr:hypothetical protein F2P56_002294 [Juglans regia]